MRIRRGKIQDFDPKSDRLLEESFTFGINTVPNESNDMNSGVAYIFTLPTTHRLLMAKFKE